MGFKFQVGSWKLEVAGWMLKVARSARILVSGL